MCVSNFSETVTKVKPSFPLGSRLLCYVFEQLQTHRKIKSWFSGNALVAAEEGLRLKSLGGQIGHSVANGSPPLQRFFERSNVARAQ